MTLDELNEKIKQQGVKVEVTGGASYWVHLPNGRTLRFYSNSRIQLETQTLEPKVEQVS